MSAETPQSRTANAVESARIHTYLLHGVHTSTHTTTHRKTVRSLVRGPGVKNNNLATFLKEMLSVKKKGENSILSRFPPLPTSTPSGKTVSADQDVASHQELQFSLYSPFISCQPCSEPVRSQNLPAPAQPSHKTRALN